MWAASSGVIAEHEPDIVCLQELDVRRARTGFVNQAESIADGLAMSFHFHPAMLVEAEQYGDAILTLRPERLIKSGPLPSVRGVPGLEPRGALWVEIDFDGVGLNVFNTHLGLIPREQRLQAAALVGSDWLGHPDCVGPTLLSATSTPPRHPSLPDADAPAGRLPAQPGLQTVGQDLPVQLSGHPDRPLLHQS
jgi:endonuclease/exonuclease/phosphatase family metal-dependent hydrolase